MENETSKKRLIHYDLLRILACFSVVMLHSAAQFWYTLPITGRNWQIANTYDALFRFGVPVFVMISGALFLPEHRTLSVKKLYTHNILRLLCIYTVWSCAYGLLDYRSFHTDSFQAEILLKEMLAGRYHLWFLPMLIGLYILLPVLRIWIRNADKRNLQYFLALFLILQIGKSTFIALFPKQTFLYLASLADFDMVCGYMGYFVLGYYLSHYGLARKYSRLLYAAAVPASVCNAVLSSLLSQKRGVPAGDIYDSFGIFTFIVSAALFLFVTKKTGGKTFSPLAEKIVSELSQNTLGIYIMHVGAIELLERFGLHSMTLPCIVGIPLLTVSCFLCCGLAAAVLRRIPLIGRYLC